jgi:hypothetical protein
MLFSVKIASLTRGESGESQNLLEALQPILELWSEIGHRVELLSLASTVPLADRSGEYIAIL